MPVTDHVCCAGLTAPRSSPKHFDNPEWPLEKLTQSWKRFTARQINKLLDRSGNLWQRDYFDRLVRDEKHFANCVRYIRRNPEKARLPRHEFLLWESGKALEIL